MNKHKLYAIHGEVDKDKLISQRSRTRAYIRIYAIRSHANPSSTAYKMTSLLPTSLEYLSIIRDEFLSDAVDSFVRRSGPSLRNFETYIPRSEVAIRHLVQLPNLSHWVLAHGPPRVIPTSGFPSLKSLYLHESDTVPWLHLLASHEEGVLPNGSTSTSHTSIREALKCLDCPSTIVDSTFLSSITKFRKFITPRVRRNYCPNEGGCAFRLTDGDMENVAATLPRLESL